ncbi:unnamed protein product [Wuchereria bancrofti]|uniref:PDZ domain-containing protein n=1 Tax=Wuchereria bancrofti TaxID=6293 RepID=A0A3P7DL14_WUCBA|nr:unnamed protein product [Wuchereria bancrofti]
MVLPNGRADQEGVRIGDIVETINGKHCTSYKMFNAKVRGARDVLRLRFIRGSMLTKCKHLKHLPPAPVKPALQGLVLNNKPALSSRMHRNYPSSKIFSINPSDFIAINGYNVLFLEMLAGRKVFHATIDMDHLHRKIEYESPFLLSSDHGSQISGYNSIKEDFSDSTQSTAGTRSHNCFVHA